MEEGRRGFNQFFDKQVLEVVFGDQFIGCTFRECDIVGFGPITFDACRFDSKSTVFIRDRVYFNNCVIARDRDAPL